MTEWFLLRHRIAWLLLLTFTSLAVLTGRLFFIAMTAEHFSRQSSWLTSVRARADLEHLNVEMMDDARGRILFVNGAPWSGISTWTHNGWRHRENAAPEAGASVIGRIGLPDTWPSERSVQEQGRSGLEYTFDAALTGKRARYLARLIDSRGHPVQPGGLLTNDVSPGLNARTTVDPVWERAAERILRQTGVRRGAVVVLDVKTDRVLAIASADPAGADRAVQAITPGSIAKILTAIAAIDSYRFTPHSRFVCPGGLFTNSVKMRCWRPHGPENLVMALASSCDIAFAEIGIAVGRSRLDHVAERFGIHQSGLQRWRGASVLPEATGGKWLEQPGADPGLLANTSIGQEDARLSPLQGALLAAAIANGGRVRDASLVLDLETRNRTAITLGEPPMRRVCSGYAARAIGKGMWDAAHRSYGTACALARFDAAVKTGTAELPNGRVNAWIVGFTPHQQPAVAFAVVSEDEVNSIAHRQVFAMARALLTVCPAYLIAPNSIPKVR